MIEQSDMKNLTYSQAIELSGKYGRGITREYWQTTNQGSDEYIIVIDNIIKHSGDWHLTANDILANDWYLKKESEASDKHKPANLTYSEATQQLIRLEYSFLGTLVDLRKSIVDNRVYDWPKVTISIHKLVKLQEQLHSLTWFFREQVYDHPELLTKKESVDAGNDM